MKKSIFLITLILVSVSVAFSQDDRKTAQLEEIIKAVNVPGIQLIYTKNKKQQVYNLGTIMNGSDKKITSSTIFEAASLSKSVFTYAVLRLYDRGLIDLDKPLLDYIGEYPRFDKVDQRYKKITAKMVLRHTTGLPNWGDPKGAKLKFTPDSCFSYSGEGFLFLQRVVEKLTSKTLNQIAQEEVFGPLEMKSSSYEWTDKFDTVSSFGNSAGEIKRHSNQNAAYSLLTNAHDYSIFLQAMVDGKGLKPQTHQMMLEKSTDANWFNHPVTEATGHISWGLGVGIQRNEKGKALWHWGDNGSFKAFYMVFPDRHESLVYFTHSNKGLFITTEIIDLFFGKQNTWAIKWIDEGYDFPYAIKDFRVALEKQGFDHASEIAGEQTRKNKLGKLTEHDLNEYGFILMQQNKKTEAIEIFKLNIALNPDSANAYDSLAEAYQATGNKELAIKNFKYCLELNPKNDYAAEQLKKLEAGGSR
jgi:CubicO group peptidase (beta-lactamase class C family)